MKLLVLLFPLSCFGQTITDIRYNYVPAFAYDPFYENASHSYRYYNSKFDRVNEYYEKDAVLFYCTLSKEVEIPQEDNAKSRTDKTKRKEAQPDTIRVIDPITLEERIEITRPITNEPMVTVKIPMGNFSRINDSIWYEVRLNPQGRVMAEGKIKVFLNKPTGAADTIRIIDPVLLEESLEITYRCKTFQHGTWKYYREDGSVQWMNYNEKK